MGSAVTPAWAEPDPATAPAATLERGLEVQLIEQRPDGWAHVLCSNGWSAWTDGRHLRAATGEHESKPQLVKEAMRAGVVLGPLAAAGGAAMIVASFLPWFTAGPTSASGWDVGLWWVVTGSGNGNSGLKVGLPLVVAGAVAILLVLARRRIRTPVLIALAAVGSWTAIFALSRVLRPDPHPDIGIGAIVALAAAALITIDGYRDVRRAHGRP